MKALGTIRLEYSATPSKLILDHIEYLHSELNRVNQMVRYISNEVSESPLRLKESIAAQLSDVKRLVAYTSLLRYLSLVLIKIIDDSNTLIIKRYKVDTHFRKALVHSVKSKLDSDFQGLKNFLNGENKGKNF